MKKTACLFLLILATLAFCADENKEHGTYTPVLSKRASGDTESDKDYVGYSDENDFSKFDIEKSNTYKMSVTPPSDWHFIPNSSCSGEVTQDGKSSVAGKKCYQKGSVPASVYIIEMSGQLGLDGNGGAGGKSASTTTWGAYVRNKYYWIEASGFTEKNIISLVGKSITFNAYERGQLVNSSWLISRQSGGTNVKKTASIFFKFSDDTSVAAWRIPSTLDVDGDIYTIKGTHHSNGATDQGTLKVIAPDTIKLSSTGNSEYGKSSADNISKTFIRGACASPRKLDKLHWCKTTCKLRTERIVL